MKTKKNIVKALTTRMFVALIVFGVVGWVILFGKNLPSSFTPIVYVLVVISIIISTYVLWKKPKLLQNRKVIIGLVIFTVIGAIGWLSSISEITSCRPYKCGETFTCAKPSELGLKISIGECTSEFRESVDFFCTKENNICTMKPSKP